jgi:hypothetical protein
MAWCSSAVTCGALYGGRFPPLSAIRNKEREREGEMVERGRWLREREREMG